jgi:hypothetical protein
VLFLVASLFPLTVAFADPPACQQYDSLGFCVVVAQQPGSVGGVTSQPVSTGSTSDRGAGSVASCTLEPGGIAVPCQDGDGAWVQGMQCYASVLAEQPPRDSPVWGGHTDGAVYLCTFFSNSRSIAGTNGFTFWSAAAPATPAAVDPAQLARQALRTLTVPSPAAGRYPAGTMQDGRPFTVVGAHTWYWTDPGSFRPLTARADAGGVWSQVTVTPTALTFDPGDGAAAVSCRGPGVAWRQGDGVWGASPAGCDYRYPHSSIHQPSGEVTATYGIDWSVTWTSSIGAGGALPGLTTTSRESFAVAEVESVVIR